MTDMRQLLRYSLLPLLFAALMSCSGVIDDSDSVPEGVLRVFADKTEIMADGVEAVTFRVMYGSQDVSSEKTLQLVMVYDGQEKSMSYGAHSFSTATPGEYTFRARYFHSGMHESDNEVKIVAKPYFTGEEKAYARRTLATYFTSINCSSCPSAASGLKLLQSRYPGLIIAAAFHSNDLGADPMTCSKEQDFSSVLARGTGLPRLFWNMRKGTELIGPVFDESYESEISSFTPQSGVAINTVLDKNTSELSVTVGITSNLSRVYRVLILLVEDGINYTQMGASGPYVHNNVVRDVLVSSVPGDAVNDNLPMTVGVESSVTRKVKLNSAWNLDNMRVVASSLYSEDGGYAFVADNTNECKVGESVSYIYAE